MRGREDAHLILLIGFISTAPDETAGGEGLSSPQVPQGHPPRPAALDLRGGAESDNESAYTLVEEVDEVSIFDQYMRPPMGVDFERNPAGCVELAVAFLVAMMGIMNGGSEETQ